MSGGASNELGSDHRAGVAAYLAVAGMYAERVVPDLEAVPTAIDLETTDATDDIRCEMSDGTTWFIQAKVRGSLAEPFRKTAAQWAQQVLDDDDEVVMASAHFSRTIVDAQAVFTYDRSSRGQRPNRASLANAEKVLRVAELVDTSLPERIRQRARFFTCDTGDDGAQRTIAEERLKELVGHGRGAAAFEVLARRFAVAARRQERTTLEDWVAALEDAGLEVIADRDGPPGRREALRHRCERSYRAALSTRADLLDLATLVPGMPTVPVDDLLSDWDLDRPELEDRTSPQDAHLVARRVRRLLISGLPGMGKSTMLEQLAARWSTDSAAPLPVLVRFPAVAHRVDAGEELSLELLASLAAYVDNSEHHGDVLDAIVEAVHRGRAVFLIDGLDETFALLGRVLSGLRRLVEQVSDQVGWVVTSRPGAAAVFDAEEMGFERTSLVFSGGAQRAVNAILSYEARRQNVAEDERSEWITKRSEWYVKRARAGGGSDALLDTPMHVSLLASHVARHGVTEASISNLLPVVIRERAHLQRDVGTIGGPPGGWDAAVRDEMALDVIVALGHALASDGTLPFSTAEEIAAIALERWELPNPIRSAIARQLIWFWDERAAVLTREGDDLRARSRRWVDVADALWLGGSAPDRFGEWLDTALQVEGRREAVLLAAALVPGLLDAIQARLRSSTDTTVEATRALVTWIRDRGVGMLDTAALQEDLFTAAPSMPSHIGGGTLSEQLRRAGMLRDDIIETAASLPVDSARREQRDAMLDDLVPSKQHRRVLSAISAVADADADAQTELPDAVLQTMDAVAVARTPSGPAQYDRRTGTLTISGSDPLGVGVDALATRIAESNLELTPAQVSWVFDALWRSASRDYERGTAALKARGYDDPKPERLTNGLDLSGLRSHDAYLSFEWLLLPIAAPNSDPMTAERWRLSALAALLQSTSVGELSLPESSQLVDADPIELHDWLDLAVTATGADWSAIRSDACYALSLDWDDLTRALFLLCRDTKTPSVDQSRFIDGDWQRVERLLRSPVPYFTNAALTYILRGEHPVSNADDMENANLSAQAAHNIALSVIGTSTQETRTAIDMLGSERPAVRLAAAHAAFILAGSPNADELLANCFQDDDWSIRVAAGADLETAEGASWWSCPNCEHRNDGVSALPCAACVTQRRPNIRR